MEIPYIANKGNVDRGNGRTDKSDASRVDANARAVQDHATISATGRDTLAAIEGLAERARKQGSERQDLVDAARLRLDNGELTSGDAIDRTARALLDSGFLAG